MDVPAAESSPELLSAAFSAAEATVPPVGVDLSTLSEIAYAMPPGLLVPTLSAVLWVSHTTISLLAVKQSMNDLQAALALQATTQAKGFQDINDRFQDINDKFAELIKLHSTVSETKGEVSQLGKSQESCSQKVVSTTPPPFCPRHLATHHLPPLRPIRPPHLATQEKQTGDIRQMNETLKDHQGSSSKPPH